MAKKTDTPLRRAVLAAMSAAEEDPGHTALEANAQAVARVLIRQWPPEHKVSLSRVRGLGATLQRTGAGSLEVKFEWDGNWGTISGASGTKRDVRAKRMFLKRLHRVLGSIEGKNRGALDAGRAAVTPPRPKLGPAPPPRNQLTE